VPGYGTKSTNNSRLWECKPKRGFDLNSFHGVFFWSPDLVVNFFVTASWKL